MSQNRSTGSSTQGPKPKWPITPGRRKTLLREREIYREQSKRVTRMIKEGARMGEIDK